MAITLILLGVFRFFGLPSNNEKCLNDRGHNLLGSFNDYIN